MSEQVAGAIVRPQPRVPVPSTWGRPSGSGWFGWGAYAGVTRYLRYVSQAVGDAMARIRPAVIGSRVPALDLGAWELPGSVTPGPAGWFSLAAEVGPAGFRLRNRLISPADLALAIWHCPRWRGRPVLLITQSTAPADGAGPMLRQLAIELGAPVYASDAGVRFIFGRAYAAGQFWCWRPGSGNDRPQPSGRILPPPGPVRGQRNAIRFPSEAMESATRDRRTAVRPTPSRAPAPKSTEIVGGGPVSGGNRPLLFSSTINSGPTPPTGPTLTARVTSAARAIRTSGSALAVSLGPAASGIVTSAADWSPGTGSGFAASQAMAVGMIPVVGPALAAIPASIAGPDVAARASTATGAIRVADADAPWSPATIAESDHPFDPTAIACPVTVPGLLPANGSTPVRGPVIGDDLLAVAGANSTTDPVRRPDRAAALNPTPAAPPMIPAAGRIPTATPIPAAGPIPVAAPIPAATPIPIAAVKSAAALSSVPAASPVAAASPVPDALPDLTSVVEPATGAAPAYGTEPLALPEQCAPTASVPVVAPLDVLPMTLAIPTLDFDIRSVALPDFATLGVDLVSHRPQATEPAEDRSPDTTGTETNDPDIAVAAENVSIPGAASPDEPVHRASSWHAVRARTEDDDRERMRTVLGWKFQTHSRTVARAMSMHPGLRTAIGAHDVVTGLVAVLAMLDTVGKQVNTALRDGATPDDDMTMLARCAAAGLVQLPAVGGPVFGVAPAGVDPSHRYRPGDLVVEPAFTEVSMTGGDGTTPRYAIWSATARRLDQLRTPQELASRGGWAMFAAGTRFVVLDVDEDGSDAGRCILLREVVFDRRDSGLDERVTRKLRDALAVPPHGSAVSATLPWPLGLDGANRPFTTDPPAPLAAAMTAREGVNP